MKLYIITQEGVYRHSVRGIFLSLAKAMEAGKACAEDPKCDGYHTYDVNEGESDIPLEDVTKLGTWSKSISWDRATNKSYRLPTTWTPK